MEQQELYLLITRHFNEQTVPWEEDFLAEWLESTEENRQTYSVLKDIWQSSRQQHDEVLVNAALRDVKQRISSRQQSRIVTVIKRYRTQIAAAAAVTGIIIGSVLYLRHNSGSNAIAYMEKKSLPGQVLKVTMPDSTVVHLAPQSSIRYAQDFGKGDRKIILEGEAFFDVSKDAHHPFTVQVGQLSVQVLGTRFNVAHYKGVDSAAVSLVDGKVQVSVPAQPKPYELQPGQELYYDSHAQHAYTRAYDVESVTGWTSRLLVFRNETLAVVARRLEQLYDVEITFADPAMAHYKLFAKFNDKPLNYILNVIKATDNLDYTIDGKKIRFTNNNAYQSR
ncbi:FecR family protein [Chitinophaga sp. YR627]|uniref:FecR family protein n=1 Tax=Chitinophaga sp. YR627 TaxID=1881041 RepID=UPI0008F07F7A|nr:FecR family protein [Chitinophaga sp. YR627]SFO97458.1 FecR family protein [Chitinophaga sp. YR627]